MVDATLFGHALLQASCIQTADGTLPITCHGTLHTHFIALGVAYVPSLSMNLMPVGQPTNMKDFLGLDENGCWV